MFFYDGRNAKAFHSVLTGWAVEGGGRSEESGERRGQSKFFRSISVSHAEKTAGKFPK